MSDRQSDKRYTELKKKRRLGVVPVAIEVFAQHLITPKHGVKVLGLPIDALFITAFYSPESYGLNFVYGHESFEKVPEGQNLPLLDVSYEEYTAISSAPKKDKL